MERPGHEYRSGMSERFVFRSLPPLPRRSGQRSQNDQWGYYGGAVGGSLKQPYCILFLKRTLFGGAYNMYAPPKRVRFKYEKNSADPSPIIKTTIILFCILRPTLTLDCAQAHQSIPH